MSNRPKVSIILPTYNVERYFRECLDSLISQSLHEIEIIPVDDGSPDKCGEIMDEYATRDPRIKPIHKENGGYGSAVNLGFAAATGEYLAIVEPDDWCEKEMYEKLYHQAKRLDADLCKCGFFVYNSFSKSNVNTAWKNGSINILNYPTDRTFNIMEERSLISYHPSVWSCIYKRSLIEDRGIKMYDKKGVSYQDIPFMVNAMCSAEKIAVIHDFLYHWRFEPDQISSTSNCGARALTMPELCGVAIDIAKNKNMYEALKEELYYQCYLSNEYLYSRIEGKYRPEYRKLLYALFLPIRGDKSFKYSCFPKQQISFVRDYILEGKGDFSRAFRTFRRNLFQLHLNKEHKLVRLFGITFYDDHR